jgi:dTDP-4-dehydrorhamnose reductase
MRVAISGTKGLLGSQIKNTLLNNNFQVLDFSRPEYDITDELAIKDFFNKNKFDIFINCAAFTDVPKSEVDPDNCLKTNSTGVGYLSDFCAKQNIFLIHFSTDFVFDGNARNPYVESDTVNPLNYYGYSKLVGENNLQIKMAENKKNNFCIFRIQWLYGDNQKNFFQKILQVAKKGSEISLVSDEYGSPCSSFFISQVILKVIEKNNLNKLRGGIFHLTHNNACSRYTCGRYFLNKLGFNNVNAVSGIPDNGLKRPKYGVLNNSELSNLLGISLGTWEEDLDDYILFLKQEGNYEIN